MWCPVCGDEFQPGFERCADCQVLLVEDAPSTPSVGRRRKAEAQLLSYPNQDPDNVFEKAVAAAGRVRGWQLETQDSTSRAARFSGKGRFGLSAKGLIEIAVVPRPDGGSFLTFAAYYVSNRGEGGVPWGRSSDEADRFRAELEDVLGLPATARSL